MEGIADIDSVLAYAIKRYPLADRVAVKLFRRGVKGFVTRQFTPSKRAMPAVLAPTIGERRILLEKPRRRTKRSAEEIAVLAVDESDLLDYMPADEHGLTARDREDLRRQGRA